MTPLAIAALGRDALVMIAASLLFMILPGSDNRSRLGSAVLLLALPAFLAWAYLSEKFHDAPSAARHQAEAGELALVPTSAGWSALAIAIDLTLPIAAAMLKGAEASHMERAGLKRSSA